MSWLVRPAALADLDELMRLERLGFDAAIQETEATFAGRLRAAPGCNWVLAAPGGGLHGYLCAEFWPWAAEPLLARFARDHAAEDCHDAAGQEVYISSMVVDPAARGGGAGRLLFTTALARMQAQAPQLRSAILIVHPGWSGARRIYLGAGFSEIGSLPGYFPAADAILMRKIFTAS